jgi:hypothetical protein
VTLIHMTLSRATSMSHGSHAEMVCFACLQEASHPKPAGEQVLDVGTVGQFCGHWAKVRSAICRPSPQLERGEECVHRGVDQDPGSICIRDVMDVPP